MIEFLKTSRLLDDLDKEINNLCDQRIKEFEKLNPDVNQIDPPPMLTNEQLEQQCKKVEAEILIKLLISLLDKAPTNICHRWIQTEIDELKEDNNIMDESVQDLFMEIGE